MVIVPDPPYRSRKVLDHARGQPCTLRFACCSRNPEQTVACHIRDRHKSMGRKSSDTSIVFGCAECHRFLDEHWFEADAALVQSHVIRAMQETFEILIRDGIVIFPHDRKQVR